MAHTITFIYYFLILIFIYRKTKNTLSYESSKKRFDEIKESIERASKSASPSDRYTSKDWSLIRYTLFYFVYLIIGLFTANAPLFILAHIFNHFHTNTKWTIIFSNLLMVSVWTFIFINHFFLHVNYTHEFLNIFGYYNK